MVTAEYGKQYEGFCADASRLACQSDAETGRSPGKRPSSKAVTDAAEAVRAGLGLKQ